MDEQKSFLYHLAEAYERYRAERRAASGTHEPSGQSGWWRRLVYHLMPNVGTILVVIALLWAQSAGAFPGGRVANSPLQASTGAIAYQGRLADANGAPITNTVNMIFRLYAAAAGGVPLWEEQWTGSNAVQVSDGLFNVMLGSLTPISQDVITGNSTLFLGITVGTDDEMQPRVQLGSVPFAMQALTVPDGSITKAKLAADVSLEPPDGSITTAKIADGAVTSKKLNIDNGIEVNGGLTVNTGNIAIGAPSSYAGFHLETPEKSDSAPGAGVSISGGTTGNTNIELRQPPTGGVPYIDFANDPDTSDYDMRIILGGNDQLNIEGGTLHVAGNLTVSGAKSAVVNTARFGQRKLYAVEAPDVRFVDEGMTRLESGVARVELDPIFLETIESEYLVHVTPYGAASLYVAEIGRDYFVVKSLEGRSDVPFAWRLSASRKGFADVRLEEVKTMSPEK